VSAEANVERSERRSKPHFAHSERPARSGERCRDCGYARLGMEFAMGHPFSNRRGIAEEMGVLFHGSPWDTHFQIAEEMGVLFHVRWVSLIESCEMGVLDRVPRWVSLIESLDRVD